MRPLAILSVAFVLLAGLALTPSGSAAIEIPPIVCGPDAMCTEPELGICDHPDMCNDADCPYPVGAEGGITLKVAGTTVHNECGPQDLCSGPMRCTSPFDDGLGMAAAVNILPVCIWREATVGPAKAGFDQCRESHETFPCASPQRVHVYRQEGPVYAQVHFCFPHTPPPTAEPTTAAPPSPCGGGMTTSSMSEPTQRCPAPYPIRPCESPASLPVAIAAADPIVPLPEPRPQVHVEVSPDCHVDLFVKWDVMDCLFGEQYNPTPVGPLVTVWVWGCSPPYPPPETMAMSIQPGPCTCPPPRPLCYDVNRAIAWNDGVWMDDACNLTVDVESYCGLQGYDQHEEQVAKVTLRYQTCQQPPQE